MSSKICQNSALTSAWAGLGTLATTFRQRWIKHVGAEPQRTRLERGDQPGRAVGDTQQRRPQPRSFRSSRKPAQASVDSERRGETDEHRLAVSVDAPGGQHRLGRGVRCIRKFVASRNR